MAASITAAFEDLEAKAGERFDRAIGFLKRPPQAKPTPSHIRAAFRSVQQQDIDHLVRALIRHFGGPEADAREAIQDTFAILLQKRPEVFGLEREEWWRIVQWEARFRLFAVRESQRRIVLVDSQIDSGKSAFESGSSALPISPAACDYTWVEPPPAGGEWLPVQILGALQRYARHYRKPPREADCRPLHRLPRPATIRACFGSFGAALAAAGMPGHSRGRVPDLRAAQQCRSFRHRNNRWPDARDFRSGASELPTPKVAKRIFGSTHPGVVGEVAEAILDGESSPS
jgi:hypothetical protein